MTMYFTVIWNEPRFVTNNTVEAETYTPIDLNFLNHLWVPNIFIYDLRSFAAMNVLKKLAGVYIIGDSRVYYNQVQFYILRMKYMKLKMIISTGKIMIALLKILIFPVCSRFSSYIFVFLKEVSAFVASFVISDTTMTLFPGLNMASFFCFDFPIFT